MTNQEAIASLRTLCHTCELFPKCVHEKPECFHAIELAISALQAQDATNTEKMQQTCDQTCNQLATDCISRQAAIEAYSDLYWMDERLLRFREELDKVYDKILNLPSAQPEIIHCRECKHWLHEHQCIELSKYGTIETLPNEFCNRAERREDG